MWWNLGGIGEFGDLRIESFGGSILGGFGGSRGPPGFGVFLGVFGVLWFVVVFGVVRVDGDDES